VRNGLPEPRTFRAAREHHRAEIGRIVGLGPVGQVAGDPQHFYTQALLASLLKLTLDEIEATLFKPISGEPPSPVAPPAGCHFHPRCARGEACCAAVVPPWRELDGGRRVACHLAPPGRVGADDRTPS
jgi:peptide/nickel transport system ATP-binding protein